jgi:hypothetical protein
LSADHPENGHFGRGRVHDLSMSARALSSYRLMFLRLSNSSKLICERLVACGSVDVLVIYGALASGQAIGSEKERACCQNTFELEAYVASTLCL